MPVVSTDFCFSRGEGEVDEELKEDLRVYQADLRGGTCLVVTDDWSHGVLSIPTPGQGKSTSSFPGRAGDALHRESLAIQE